MAKYVAIIDTDEYKDFRFFEDGCGEYLVARDENAQSDEWIRLPFVKAETVLIIPEIATNGDVIKAVFPDADIEYWAEYSTYNVEFPNDNDVKHFSYDWWNTPYEQMQECER